ncbi:MAG TPA: prolyl oligopeptidase family serine peptidase [Candidatus Krumholzibacteria bacterium]|nr:prolyl oligopeptidase family serine peptidase [Candidatus Krumholzibacteria bacterium]
MRRIAVRIVLLLLLLAPSRVMADRPMTWTDLMKMRKVHGTTMAENGSWLAFEARPGRGDGEVVVRATRGGDEYRIERGSAPRLSTDGAWGAAQQLAPFAVRETADEPPEPGAVLLRTEDGEQWSFERVKAYAFSDDGAWFALHFEADEPDSTEDAETVETEAEADETQADEEKREAGTRVAVLRLSDLERFEFESVVSMAFDPTSRWLALTIATADGEDDRLELRSLDDGLRVATVHAAPQTAYPAMAWAPEDARLAYLRGDASDPENVTGVVLELLSPRAGDDVGPVTSVPAPEGRRYPTENDLEFTRDGERLFVGLRPVESGSDPDDEGGDAADGEGEGDSVEDFDPYDLDAIRDDREVDVWHWDDPRIKTHEKASWEERQEQLHRAVVDVADASLVSLADETMPDVAVVQNPHVTHGETMVPHLELMTWDGFYSDHYVVDLDTGQRTLVVEKTQDTVSLSPEGGFVAYYRPTGDGQWWLYDVEREDHRRLGEDLGVPFANEDHDYPRSAPGYGVGGWADDDSVVLIHDKYDVWRFPTDGGEPVCLTEGRGRAEQRIYRVLDLDDDKEGFAPDAELLLTGFDERAKNSSVWRGAMDSAGVRELRQDDKFYSGFRRADEADVVVYTEESYTEFPDFWVTDTDFDRPRRITEINPRLDDLDLGSAELVEWESVDGTPLQGVLIKPADYDEDERYPVLVYFYRFFSQRLHRFNDPQINHRPSFPIYAGDDYAVFLPDVRFDVGNPGYAATKCLVPGVQELVDMGVADPDGIALHGHSWSGYQAAHVITQTDIFACAVAGAPVSNMVSAYGGIRWGSGLSRQFQYEKSQSRLGASLWERRDLYIENSPVFFADRIETPLLIQFGDEDEAVPWTQGIELYMAMRRLDKPAVMLQYRGEPHHLKQYPNKLDYSLRMKAFIDHFTKGAPAPEWWTEGVEYTGDAE